MLYQEDLSEAFYRKDIGAIEAAFRALVGDPDADEVETPDTVLLIACCRALADDHELVPSGTIDAINGVTSTGRDDALAYNSTYAAAAGRVWKEIERFAPCFGEMPRG